MNAGLQKILAALAIAALPFIAGCVSEAERQRVAAEKAERERLAKLEQERLEKQVILNRLQSEIFPAEERLYEEECSRGRALLDAFGDEHMPALAERCRDARKAYLEAEAGFKALSATLREKNIDPKTNDVFQTAERNYLNKAADYWRLRYKLTDCYSQFKIGVITADELAARDKEFAEQ